MLSFRDISDLQSRGTYLGVQTAVLVEGVGFYKITESGLTADGQDIIDMGGTKRAESVLLTGSTFVSGALSVNQSHSFTETQGVKISSGGFSALSAGETQEAVVIKVIDSDNYIVAFCGAFDADFTTTWNSLTNGTYYHTDSGTSSTADSPVRPMFVKRDEKVIISPMIGFSSSLTTLFTKDEADGTTVVSQGDTVEFTAAKNKYSAIWVDGATTITNTGQALDLLLGQAKASANRSGSGTLTWQASDNGATVWIVGNGTFTLPASPNNNDSVNLFSTGASSSILRNGQLINNGSSDFSMTQNTLHIATFTTGQGWAIR